MDTDRYAQQCRFARRTRAKLDLKDNGTLEGKLKITFTGHEARIRRVEERNEDDANRKKFLEDEVRESVRQLLTWICLNKPEWHNSNEPLVAEFNFKVGGWVSGAGRRALLPVGLFSEEEKHLFEHAERTYPIYFEYPYKKVDDLKIELPLGWKTGSIPKPYEVNGKSAEYKLTVEDGGVTLHVQARTSLRAGDGSQRLLLFAPQFLSTGENPR